MALSELDRVLTQRRTDRMQRWTLEKTSGKWSHEWCSVAITTDYLMQLTPAELEALDDALHSVVERARQESVEARGRAPRPDEGPVFMTISAFPFVAGE